MFNIHRFAKMSIETRSSIVYPTFHDTQQQQKQKQQQHQQRQQQQQQQSKLTKKDMDIDNSIYHLLSMYLDTNVNGIIPPTTQNSRMMMMATKPLPYSRRFAGRPPPLQRQNWLGEKKESLAATCTELERNTIQNSCTIQVDDDTSARITSVGNDINRKTRSKSVSFNETITVIDIENKVGYSHLIQPLDNSNISSSKHGVDDDDEDLFVDALENCTE